MRPEHASRFVLADRLLCHVAEQRGMTARGHWESLEPTDDNVPVLLERIAHATRPEGDVAFTGSEQGWDLRRLADELGLGKATLREPTHPDYGKPKPPPKVAKPDEPEPPPGRVADVIHSAAGPVPKAETKTEPGDEPAPAPHKPGSNWPRKTTQ